MSITIHPAAPADIPELIDIFFAAFAPDPLLIGICYPDTPANRAFWTRSVLSQMRHPEAPVFKAVLINPNCNTGKTIGWAKWLFSPPKSSQSTESSDETRKTEHEGTDSDRQGALDPNDTPSPDMDMVACQALADGQYKMFDEVIGGRGCYWLNAISVHPTYHRLGAATALVREGTQLADESGLECFAACTDTASRNMKNVFLEAGFKIVGSEEVVNGMKVWGGYREKK